MKIRFQHQVAIVAGGARGIGLGIALRLSKEGAKVIVMDVQPPQISPSDAHDLESTIVDITNENQVKKAIGDIFDNYGRLDILANSAGIVGPSAVNIDSYSLDAFENVLNVNLKGPFLLTKYSIPYMLKNNYGRILHITSIGGKEGNPGMIGYAASKSGLMGLIKGAGKEFAASGITINGIAPAVIATPMNKDTDPKMLQYMTDKIPMKRLGTIEEVAALACWIVSEEASFNTGVIFDLSGGRATY